MQASQVLDQGFQNLFTPIHINTPVCLILDPEMRMGTQPLGGLLAVNYRAIMIELPIPQLDR